MGCAGVNELVKIDAGRLKKKAYRQQLCELQVELVKLQRHVIANNQKLLVLFEGRDAGGKDGTIKRVAEHLSPRETRVVALGKPSDRERGAWYFQRFVPHLPIEREIVLFNRSWYNRAGVERVMGFCAADEVEQFLDTVPQFEQMLVRSGIRLFKYYLDISKKEQIKRLRRRCASPLRAWKVSPIDDAATEHWSDYSQARNEMFARSHSSFAPWNIVRADDKRAARLAVIRDLLSRLEYEGKDPSLVLPNPDVVFVYDDNCVEAGALFP